MAEPAGHRSRSPGDCSRYNPIIATRRLLGGACLAILAGVSDARPPIDPNPPEPPVFLFTATRLGTDPRNFNISVRGMGFPYDQGTTAFVQMFDATTGQLLATHAPVATLFCTPGYGCQTRNFVTVFTAAEIGTGRFCAGTKLRFGAYMSDQLGPTAWTTMTFPVC